MEIATGIVGLIGFAASVGNQARAFFDGWADAPSDIQLILNNVRDLEANLREIESLLKTRDATPSSLAAEEEERFRPVITDCSTTFAQLEGHMKKYDRVGSNKAKRTRWLLWGQKDYVRLGQRVECHKTTLILKLLLTRYANAANSNQDGNVDYAAEVMEQFRRLQSGLGNSNPAVGQWLETATSYAETIYEGSVYARSTCDEVALIDDRSNTPQQIDIPPDSDEPIQEIKRKSIPSAYPYLTREQALNRVDTIWQWRQSLTSLWPTYIVPMNSGNSTNDWSNVTISDANRDILKSDGTIADPLWNFSRKEAKLSTYLYLHIISIIYIEAKSRERDSRFEWTFGGLTKHSRDTALVNSSYAVLYMKRSLKSDVVCDEKLMSEDTRHLRWPMQIPNAAPGSEFPMLKIDQQVKLACMVMPKEILLTMQRDGLRKAWDNDPSKKMTSVL